MLLQILTAPVSLPFAGLRFILERVAEMAEQELYDEERIKADLLLLQYRLEEGEIDENEYAAEEAVIMERLRAARAARAGRRGTSAS